MSNMSYCRFQNTFNDLQDCLGALEEGDTIYSKEEKNAAIALLSTMANFVIDNNLILDEDFVAEGVIALLVQGSMHRNAED